MESLSQPTVQTSSSLSALKAFSIVVVNQGDDLVTIFMQKTKTLFDKLAAASRPVSLEDFNLYLFRGLRSEFKDLVRTLVTKAEPLLYPELHSHFLTHEFLHKTSLHSMSVVATALLMPMSTHPPSAHGAQRQPSSSYNSNYNFSCGKNDLVEAGVTIITATITTLMYGLIFEVFIALQATTGGRVIGNKTNKIIALYSGLMSRASYVKPLIIQPLIVLNFKVIDNSLMSILCSIMLSQQIMWIGFPTLVQINTSHLILQI
jgi:hypothetical protein